MRGVNAFVTVPVITCSLLLVGCSSGSTTGSSNLPTEVPFGDHATRVLSPVSGNHQVCPPGETLPEPLEVILTNSEGRPVAGAKIFWTVSQGRGEVLTGAYPTADGANARQVSYTDSQGMSSVHYLTGAIPGRNEVVADAIYAKDRPRFTSNTR